MFRRRAALLPPAVCPFYHRPRAEQMTNNSSISPRAYAAAHFALELHGIDKLGVFRSVEGGSIKCDVMTYQHGGNYDRWRQLGKAKFEDIKLQFGMAMSQG